MIRSLHLALRRYRGIHSLLLALKRAGIRFNILALEVIRRLPGPANLGFAKGFYSDLELLQAQKLDGRVVLLDQGNIEAAPDSLLALCGRGQHQQQPWPVFWTHHHEAELIGASLAHIDAKRRLCKEAVFYRMGKEDPAYFYSRYRSKALELEGNWTSLVSVWMPTTHSRAYGHWILEMLPRLALLKEFPPDTQIIVPPFRLRYELESLEMLGLYDRCRWTSEQHIRIENYYFSAPPSMIACYNPYAIHWIRDAFLPLVKDDDRPTPARFFVRRHGDLRNMVNEAEVLAFFRKIGWEIVDAAALSFAEQIRYFSRAEAICSIHGSGFTNALWCKPGAKLLELFADTYLASDAEWIAKCIPPTVHRHLIFPSDHNINAIVDLDRVRNSLRELDLL
jgi:capsular polysaccharide biosynthesis protein